jgi:hypothetical protein
MRRVWRSGTEIAGVVHLIEAGLSDREAAHATGIPYETIRAWRRGRLPERARRVLAGVPECAGCGAAAHDLDSLPPYDYAYLLGMYLGDGCLARTAKGGYSLRISLDSAYPGIIESARRAIAAVKGGALPPAAPHPACACVVITSYWKTWPCLFPQHGPGRKHERRIVLESWQQDMVAAAPEAFLRALIHTDGWRGTNRVRVKGRTTSIPVTSSRIARTTSGDCSLTPATGSACPGVHGVASMCPSPGARRSRRWTRSSGRRPERT